MIEDGSPQWTSSSKTEIASLVSGPLPDLPAHDELYKRVLSAGGGVFQRIYRDVFEAVPVTDLPPAGRRHDPHRGMTGCRCG